MNFRLFFKVSYFVFPLLFGSSNILAEIAADVHKRSLQSKNKIFRHQYAESRTVFSKLNNMA